MAENTNNSLSDLNNEGKKFNTLLSSDSLKNPNSNLDKIKKLEDDNASLKITYQKSSNKDTKEAISNTITYNQNEINKLSNLSDFDTNQSLFDRDAMIDYGRYLNSDGTVKANWKEYNKSEKEYLLNNTAKINTPVLFKDNSLFSANNNTFSNEGLSIPNLIQWSEKYPALQLRYQDFVYCRKLGYYPNNRMVVLRRFKGGVPDNLFDYYKKDIARLEFTQPLSTMITWLSPEDEIIDMEFNEEWVEYNSSMIETIKNSVNNFIGGYIRNKKNNIRRI